MIFSPCIIFRTLLRVLAAYSEGVVEDPDGKPNFNEVGRQERDVAQKPEQTGQHHVRHELEQVTIEPLFRLFPQFTLFLGADPATLDHIRRDLQQLVECIKLLESLEDQIDAKYVSVK